MPPVTVYYSHDYVAAGHAFDTTRKARWVADSLAENPIAGIELVAPPAAREEQVLEVHDAKYVTAVRTGEPRPLAQSQGFTWDEALWPMVLASNGGAVAAALTALRGAAVRPTSDRSSSAEQAAVSLSLESGKKATIAGSLSSGLHHARRDRGNGYCTFNGLALAADAALQAGAGQVLIVDLDAHCGGGTHSLLRTNEQVWQMDVSVDPFDRYSPAERETLDLVRIADEYLPTVERRLAELATKGIRFNLCLYNAGMDPHEDCAVGGLRGITAEILRHREQLVFSWCRQQALPVAFVLAGGYIGSRLEVAALVELHRLTLAAAADSATASPPV